MMSLNIGLDDAKDQTWRPFAWSRQKGLGPRPEAHLVLRSPPFAAPVPASHQVAAQIAAAGGAPAAACTVAAAAYSFDIATLGLSAASAVHTARTALPDRGPGARPSRACISACSADIHRIRQTKMYMYFF